MLEESRYFFNYELPHIIETNLTLINQFLDSIWWVFFGVSILFFIGTMYFFRKYVNKREEFIKFDKFFDTISHMRDLNKEEKFLLHLDISKYIALYQKRGDTYILIDSNADSDVGIPLRLSHMKMQKFKKSGRYNVSYFLNADKSYMLLFFSKGKIKLDKYKGHLNLLLTYYEKSVGFKEESLDTNNSNNTTLSLMKLHMDKTEFFKFLVALIKESTNAKGVKLLTKDGELIFEKIVEPAPLQKTFYIRNTPYKLDFYDDKELDFNKITQIGSFIDLSGSYIMNLDENSEMVQNYIDLLKLTNEAIELHNPFYKNHARIVQAISVEVAKSLFLSQEEIDAIGLGALLHDIGMVGDLLSLVDKDKLDNTELDLIKQHPVIGGIMVEPIAHIYNITDIIKYHHERFDGLGYPFKLRGVEIPISAGVVALGEFYAGITSDRPYRKGKTHEEAVEEIKKVSNIFFDESIVKAFLDVSERLKIKIEKIENE